MSAEKPASFGTNRLDPPVIGVASSSASVIFEWVALVPLTIYLAQAGLSHRLVGRTALAGRVVASLFPRLGVLDGIATLLRQGPDYLDRASSVSELHRTVWHVDFGSIFPCANGAASMILTKHAIRTAVKIPIRINLRELLPEYVIKDDMAAEDEASTFPRETTTNSNNNANSKGFSRPQTLYILDCTIDEIGKPDGTSKAGRLIQRHLQAATEAAVLLSLLGLCAPMILMGLYGTTMAFLISAAFRVLRLTIQVTRPDGYLQSNEPSQNRACMLAAVHENASTWYLYVGERGVVDWLLNKSLLGRVDASAPIAALLRALAALQLATMTYVAAQKGWDGVGLLVLVLAAWLLDAVAYSDDRLAKRWLRAEGVGIRAFACEFSGRVPMVGAVLALREGRVTSWMDGILAPATRRDLWLEKLMQSYASTPGSESSTASSSVGSSANRNVCPSVTQVTRQKLVWGPKDGKVAADADKEDRRWVERNFALVRAAVDDINKHIRPSDV
ncbi:hypothetical protein ISF_03986 [Cordyceps fumosorosea ARSEF 2679]|uniref:Uncharacterized protein n=1 Tax=Cordyceps fumosorosea (strain ARSEF 2679) TaxID=1081104 RepID=A0A162KCQ8_CORFA|nr:hypothetical protein ISF_03986 [Cordyceps fumosorosea ARSEF 2679]OAA66148.1 hypothetical protein ISF_03986 [Cordyceps fumosorosea ARSEF 2679]